MVQVGQGIVRYVVYTAIVFASLFVHSTLKEQYHQRCNKDIFQVLFIRNSYFCQLMYRILYIIEGGWIEIATHFFKILSPM